jgi:hypothetical protein
MNTHDPNPIDTLDVAGVGVGHFARARSEKTAQPVAPVDLRLGVAGHRQNAGSFLRREILAFLALAGIELDRRHRGFFLPGDKTGDKTILPSRREWRNYYSFLIGRWSRELDSNFRSLSQRSGGFGLSSRGIR